MDIQRVTLITLGVQDLAAAKGFYERLGWVQRDGTDGVAFYQMQGAVLGLFGQAELAVDQGRPGATLGTGAITLAQNFATAAQVDAAFAQALAAGATALKQPEKVFWGGYSGYWADLDGHVWEVAMNPFWPLGPGGSLTLPGAVETIAEQDLGADDDRQIADLLARCFATDFGGRSYFMTRHHWRHVLRDGGQIVAHMGVQLRSMRLGGRLITVAGLSDVASDPAHRGKGLAATLLQAAIQRAKDSPAEYFLLFGTAGLYAGAGFRKVTNPMTYLDLTGAKTAAVHHETAESLMVLPLRDTAWQDEADLDLLGGLF
jgi:predicted N-acetyltransferase YhbS/predicted lactoylglutathione lyase